jgi:hypothetical protein
MSSDTWSEHDDDLYHTQLLSLGDRRANLVRDRQNAERKRLNAIRTLEPFVGPLYY